MRLNVVTFIHIRHTCKLIVTNRIRCVHKTCFSVFNFNSIFKRVSSHFQLWNINLRCITWHFSNNLRIDMRLNIMPFVHIRSARKLIITNCIRRVYEAFVSILDLSSIFKRITSCFQLRNVDLWRIPRNFSDHFLIVMSSNTLFLSSLTCISIVFNFFQTCQSWIIFNKFFTCFFVYVKCNLNFFRLTFWRITRYFSDNLRIDVSLNIVSFIHIRHTRELIVTDCIRCIYEAFFRVFNIRSIFSLITSYFQLRNIDLWRITRNFSHNLSIDMRLNITSFIRFSCSCKLIVTNNLRCIFKAYNI